MASGSQMNSGPEAGRGTSGELPSWGRWQFVVIVLSSTRARTTTDSKTYSNLTNPSRMLWEGFSKGTKTVRRSSACHTAPSATDCETVQSV